MSLSPKDEEGLKYINFPFSHDIVLEQNHIAMFISLSLINICQNYIGFY